MFLIQKNISNPLNLNQKIVKAYYYGNDKNHKLLDLTHMQVLLQIERMKLQQEKLRKRLSLYEKFI